MNKYNAKKTKVDGITFDSKRESNRYLELKLLQRAVVLGNAKDEDTDALKVVSNAFAVSDALYNKEV